MEKMTSDRELTWESYDNYRLRTLYLKAKEWFLFKYGYTYKPTEKEIEDLMNNPDFIKKHCPYIIPEMDDKFKWTINPTYNGIVENPVKLERENIGILKDEIEFECLNISDFVKPLFVGKGIFEQMRDSDNYVTYERGSLNLDLLKEVLFTQGSIRKTRTTRTII